MADTSLISSQSTSKDNQQNKIYNNIVYNQGDMEYVKKQLFHKKKNQQRMMSLARTTNNGSNNQDNIIDK